MRVPRSWLWAAPILAFALVVVAAPYLGHGEATAAPSQPVRSTATAPPDGGDVPVSRGDLLMHTDRIHKAMLVERLAAAPQVLILGGSRALRFDPAYIKRRTGLRGFNAAVTGARPDDAWAFVNLVHGRFPRAHTRYLWIIHADEFDPEPFAAALVHDPILSRYFPTATLAAQPGYRRDPVFVKPDPAQLTRVYARDGMTLSDMFSRANRSPGHDSWIVHRRIAQALRLYAARPLRLSRRCERYFARTVRLMVRIDPAPPVIVAAPVDARILRATRGRGWGTRHKLLLAFLARLRRRYRFDFIDLSRAARCGCTARDFYDGIHLRPSGTRKVVNAVLRRFPGAFAVSR